MITGSTIPLERWQLVLIGIVAAAWIAAAVWATIVGLRRQQAAAGSRVRLARLESLFDASPAVPLLVDASGRIETPPRLARWLGFDRLPATLPDFDDGVNGLAAADLATLERLVAEAMRAATNFTLRAGVRGSDRRLRILGGPAPAALKAGRGALLLWVYDATEAGQTIRRLDDQVGELGAALDSLAALIEAAPIPMWHRGPDLRLSLVNSAYVRAVEATSAGEVIARGLELVEADGESNPLASASAAQSESRIQVRSAPATIDGARRMLRIVDVPLGEMGVAGYAVDVEDLEQARADLSRFSRAQRDLLDRLSAGVTQFGADGSLVFFNQPFVRLFAMRPEWLADRPEFDRVLERMREAGRLPETRDFPTWKAERRRWFISPEEPVEENWLLPGGSHLRVLAQPLPDGGLLIIFEDRTEQLRLASARDTLLRVRTATFDNLFEAIGVFAADGRLSIWNNRFRDVWGLEEEVLAQHPRVDALVDAVARKITNPARASLIRELVRIATVERQQRSGRVQLTDGRHFEFAAVPLPDGNALFAMLDVTDSRRVEAALRASNEALEEADRVKTAFVAGMSYELRTPLTSIGGFAEMLAGGYAGPLTDSQAEYVRAITASVDRLSLLIDDVLDLTQNEAGGLPADAEAVRFGDLIREGAEAADAASERVTISVKADPLAGTVEVDRRRLGGAFADLVRFAVARTGPGNKVRLIASGTVDQAELIVHDDGEVIDEKELARLFTRFPDRATGGVGNDDDLRRRLPSARRAIEAHGGTLEISSDGERGATIRITLPRVRPHG